eukprot:scaffold3878_cov363-Prasinococcus_capsulatus_cf.AAC.11
MVSLPARALAMDALMASTGVMMEMSRPVVSWSLRVVRSIWVQPEDGLGARGPCTCNCQPNPVGDRCRLRLAHTPDVALVHLVLEDHFVAGAVHDLHHTFALDLECLVVAAVLLCLLRHEAHVADVAHGGNVEAAVRLAIGNAGLVHTRVAPIWDQALHVLKFTLFVPHLARVAHDAWHRGVDNDVGGNVQVGDAARGIHHGQARSLLVAGLQIGLDGFPFSVGQSLELCIERGQAMVGVHAQACKCSGVLLEGALEKHRHHVPEDDRVGHLRYERNGSETRNDFLIAEGSMHNSRHTFIMVALRCRDTMRFSFLACASSSSTYSLSAAADMHEASITSPACSATFSFNTTLPAPSALWNSMRTEVGAAIT